jgi:hypothetical protein
MNLAPYRKTVAAIAIGLLGWGGSVVTSTQSPITASEWLQLGTVVATALGVYQVTNERVK